jgi:plasmid maintenance system antidote protein VapI
MRLEDLLTILSKKTESYVNQSLLAESLGVTRQTISNRIKNESQVTVSELKKIEDSVIEIEKLREQDRKQQ